MLETPKTISAIITSGNNLIDITMGNQQATDNKGASETTRENSYQVMLKNMI